MNQAEGAAAPASEQAVSAPATTEQATPATIIPNADAAQENAEAQDSATQDQGSQDEPRRLTRNQRLQRKAARLSTMVAEQAAEIEKLRATQAKSTADSEPKEADYNGDWTKFQSDHSAWKAAKLIRSDLAEREERESSRRIAERQREIADEFLDRAAEVKKSVPDYEETMKVFASQGGKFEPHVREEIFESDSGPMLAYYLAKNPAVAVELNALSPRDAAREIGRIEAKLALPQAKKQTQAPAPLSTLKGGASPGFDPFNTDDMDAYAKWRKAGGGTRKS